VDPTAAELRVLGCLIEKQRTTPEHYPLTLNALRLACNQSTNRTPVVDYDEHTVREAAQALGRRKWSRLASGQGSRAPKYRHLLDEALGIGGDEMAVLCVLLLRGPQTPGELKTRTERMHRFADLEEVLFTVEKLIARGHAARLQRRPGQKEERYAQLLGGEVDEDEQEDVRPAPVAFVATPVDTPGPAATDGFAEHDARITALEAQVHELQDQLRSLRDDLGA
jgi:uncharacterized protein YceH (UPF0502 family)